MTSTKSTNLSLRLSFDTLAQLDRLARATDRSRNYLIGEAIAQYLEREIAWLDDIDEGIAAADRGEFATGEALEAFWNESTTPEERAQAETEAARALDRPA
jgi:predicted transcriptional regulator